MGRHTVTCQICPVRLSLPGSRDWGECAGFHVENSNFSLEPLQVTSTFREPLWGPLRLRAPPTGPGRWSKLCSKAEILEVNFSSD